MIPLSQIGRAGMDALGQTLAQPAPKQAEVPA